MRRTTGAVSKQGAASLRGRHVNYRRDCAPLRGVLDRHGFHAWIHGREGPLQQHLLGICGGVRFCFHRLQVAKQNPTDAVQPV